MTELLDAATLRRTCLCLTTQRAARQLARRYDAALRPAGLTSGQFTLLAGLNQTEPVMLTDLAQALAMERTTLTRNLVPLEAAGLVATVADAADRRVRRLRLTETGRRRLGEAVPLWREAQRVGLAALADMPWPTLHRSLDRLAAD